MSSVWRSYSAWSFRIWRFQCWARATHGHSIDMWNGLLWRWPSLRGRENGLIISACVVSMDIGSLSRRLLLHTSLLFEAALRPRWLVSALRTRRDAAR